MHLLLKAANFDGQTLPLPTPINPIFAAIPEFWLQDTADMIEFVAKVSKEVINLIDAESANLLINFTTAFLISKEYFSTPFPRIAMVHMLSEIIETKSLSILAFEFTRNPLAKQYLIDGLIQFYVDIEFTDSHTQFYDKFNYRHFVTIILKFLWK
jgi:ubiquitin conjugation factor E4 B